MNALEQIDHMRYLSGCKGIVDAMEDYHLELASDPMLALAYNQIKLAELAFAGRLVQLERECNPRQP